MAFASAISLARRMAQQSPRTKFWVMVGGDALFLPLCMFASVTLRIGSLEAALGTAPAIQIALALMTLPVLAIAGLYRTVVRYIDLRVLAAASAALAAVVLLVYIVAQLLDLHVLPRSALLVYWFVAFAYVVTSRFVARSLLRRSLRPGARPRIRTAIYGAGDAGAQLAHAMQFSTEYRAVCFFDDRRDVQRKTVAGLRVYSPERLDEAVIGHDVAQIVVAIPSASAAQKRRLISHIESSGLPVKILPGLVEMEIGRAHV